MCDLYENNDEVMFWEQLDEPVFPPVETKKQKEKQKRNYLDPIMQFVVFLLGVIYAVKRGELELPSPPRLRQRINSHFVFAQVEGFHLATALVSTGSDQAVTMDPSIGELKLYLKAWGGKEKPGVHFTELATRPCSEEDFLFAEGAANEKSLFFTAHWQAEEDLRKHAAKMTCLEQPALLFGDTQSRRASNLMVVFETCEGRTCQSDQAIAEWLADKQIVTLHNEVNFKGQVRGEEKVIKSSHFEWYPVVAGQRTEYVQRIAAGELQWIDTSIQDKPLFTRSGRDQLQSMTRSVSALPPIKNVFHTTVAFEVDPD